MVLVPAMPVAYAKGVGGATEITQLANNSQLLFQVAEAMQQTVKQINMLTTMLQNLQSLSNLGAIAEKLGIPLSGLDGAIKAFGGIQATVRAFGDLERSANRFGNAARGVGHFYSDLVKYGVDVNRDNRIDERDMQIISSTMNVRQRERARHVLTRRMRTLRDMRDSYAELTAQASKIPSEVHGHLQGLKFLAGQNVGMQRLMMDTQTMMQQAQAEMDERRLAEMEQADLDRRVTEKMRADVLARIRF